MFQRHQPHAVRSLLAATLVGSISLAQIAHAQSKPARIEKPKPATERSQEDLEAQRAAKLAKPVFAVADWELDYAVAKQRANSEGKFVLTYFTRSYAP